MNWLVKFSVGAFVSFGGVAWAVLSEVSELSIFGGGLLLFVGLFYVASQIEVDEEDTF